MLQNKTIVICLPGNSYSGYFLKSLVDLMFAIEQKGGIALISQDYSSMVNFARCKVAGADVNRGKHQKPFNGMHYDYMMWIDSDIRFSTKQFFTLVDMDVDVASGWYSQPGGITPVVEHLDDEQYLENGHYDFLSAQQMTEREDVFKAGYIGFGWVLIKQGVFEQMEYPWFAPRLHKLNDDVQEMCSEDVGWCLDAKKLGIDIHVNPKCRVGHEKTIAI